MISGLVSDFALSLTSTCCWFCHSVVVAWYLTLSCCCHIFSCLTLLRVVLTVHVWHSFTLTVFSLTHKAHCCLLWSVKQIFLLQSFNVDVFNIICNMYHIFEFSFWMCYWSICDIWGIIAFRAQAILAYCRYIASAYIFIPAYRWQ